MTCRGCSVRGHAFIRLVFGRMFFRFDLLVARLGANRSLGGFQGARRRRPDGAEEGQGKRPPLLSSKGNLLDSSDERRHGEAEVCAGRRGPASELPADLTGAGKPESIRRSTTHVASASPEGSRSAGSQSWESAVQRETIFRGELALQRGRRDAVWVYVSPSFAGIVVRHLFCRRRVGRAASIRLLSSRMRRDEARCT